MFHDKDMSDYFGEIETIYSEAEMKREKENAFLERYEIAKQNGFFIPEGRTKNKACVNELAYHMRRNYNLIHSGHDFYFWNDAHYQKMPELKLKYLIGRETDGKTNEQNGFKNGFVETCAQEGFAAFDDMSGVDGFLNLKNGILDVRGKRLLPHSPDFPFYYRMNLAYDPKAECPGFMKFLDQVFDGDKDSAHLIRQFIAYTMIGGEPFLHKALCLVGSGRNGKSVLLDIIRELLGRENVSSVSMGKLDRSVNAAMLNGKLANIVEEGPTGKIDAESFKNITAGGNITMEKKYKDPIDGTIYARFIFATNSMPIFQDNTIGLVDRLKFIHFPRYFREEERDGTLKDVLLNNELPGILNWVLEELPIDKSSFKLIDPLPSKMLLSEYLEDSNSVHYFVGEKIEITSNENDIEYQSRLYEAFRLFCQYEGIKEISNRLFKKKLIISLQKHGLEWTREKIEIKRNNVGQRLRGFKLRGS